MIQSDSKIRIDAISAGGNHVPWRLSNFVENVQAICANIGLVSFRSFMIVRLIGQLMY